MGRLRLLGEQEGDGTADHSALLNLDYAKAGHTGFLSLATPQTVTAEKVIDSTVGLRFGHASGPLLQGASSGDDLTLTGDLKISGSIGLPNVYAGRVVNLQKTVSVGLIPCGIAVLLTSDGGHPIGLYGGATYAGSSSNRTAKGLDFQAASNTTAAMNQLIGLNMQVNMYSSGNVGTAYGGVIQKSYPGTGRPTTSKGLYIGDFGSSGVATAIGLHIYDQTDAANNYLLEAGRSTPYLRLVGGGDPPANKSNLYLKFGSALYRVVKSGNYMTLEAA